MQPWLRPLQALAAVIVVIGAVGACAKGDALDSYDEDGEGGSGGSGGRSSSASKGTTSSGISGPAQTTGTTNGPTTTSTTGPTTTTSTTTTGPTTTNTATTSTGMPVTCDPENPGPGCGASQHCVPQTSGDPVCEAAGAGTAYALCPNGRSECAPIYECVFDGFDACCMRWCEVAANNCGGAETCTSFSTPVYVNGVEYGACWDGLPCVL